MPVAGRLARCQARVLALPETTVQVPASGRHESVLRELGAETFIDYQKIAAETHGEEKPGRFQQRRTPMSVLRGAVFRVKLSWRLSE